MIKVNPWEQRINNSDSYYKEWSKLFKCETLEKYYENFQHSGEISGYRPYTLNLIYSTIKIKQANILFQNPEFIVEPQPGKMDWNQQFAQLSAQLKQDTLNTLVKNPRSHFADNLELAALDSYFRFGVLEVGYGADWQNPNKIPRVVDENTGEDNKEAVDLFEVPENERIYFNHIRASRFRVAVEDARYLDNCRWCGYYSWMYRSELEKTPGITMPKGYTSKFYSSDYADVASKIEASPGSKEMWALISTGQVCKVWRIWDNFDKKKLLIMDGPFEIMSEVPFERIPFPSIRWDLRAPSREDNSSSGWYPMPPVWQWISAQDEINDAREQMRNYRRRFIRKFWVLQNTVDTDELAKLATNVDGQTITVKRPDAIGLISNPEIGLTIKDSLITSMQDMNLITGTPSPARAQADRQTATATKEAALHEKIRESIEQMRFTQFVANAGREALIVFKERFAEGIWVKMAQDPGNEFLQELQEKQDIFRWVTAQDINDGYDEEILVNVVNASPQKMAEEEVNFMKFIQTVSTNPAIAMSPILIAETAYRFNYRNLKVIREMQRMAMLQMMGQIAGEMQNGGLLPGQDSSQGMNPVQQGMLMNSNPNPTQEIDAQLQEQL